ncbi:hypothetical protein [Paenibacillus glacialis]|nr:hypothetical protein [Paenibacillus glacialis]
MRGEHDASRIIGNLNIHKAMSASSGRLGKPDPAKVVVEKMRRQSGVL